MLNRLAIKEIKNCKSQTIMVDANQQRGPGWHHNQQ